MKFNTVILKVAAPCNLNCSYCYEYNRGDESWRLKPKHLLAEIATQVGKRIAEYCLDNNIKKFDVNLHGGEPLLLGASGLRAIFDALILSSGGVKLKLGIQTNATLVTPEILDTLEDYNATVGVSIDGSKRNNRYRIDHRGVEAYERIVKGLNLIRERKNLYSGLLCVVDLDSDPESILDDLSQFTPPSIDLLPPFGNYDNPPFGSPAKYNLGEWMIKAFDHWINNQRLQKIKIRYLEDALVAVISGKSRSDWFGLRPPGYFVIATDGAIEGLDSLKINGELGRKTDLTIWDASLEDLLKHEVMDLRMKEVEGLCKTCRECSIVEWCGGGYLPMRYGRGNGFNNPSFYCTDIKKLFSHIGRWLMTKKEVSSDVIIDIQNRLEGININNLI